MPFERENNLLLIFLMMIILIKKQIPTRTTPIQMNAELEQHCHIEIKDLEFKGLI